MTVLFWRCIQMNTVCIRCVVHWRWLRKEILSIGAFVDRNPVFKLAVRAALKQPVAGEPAG